VNGEGPVRCADGGVVAEGEVLDDDEEDRARLREAILASREEIGLGLGIPAAQILDELRRVGG
jgi:hypothetical protein